MVGFSRRRRGLTLVEMLVAMAISLIMIYGMVEAFGQIGKEASDGRAKIEMANQMRNVMRRLEIDLNHLTVPVRNWIPSATAPGYFEYIEGADDDSTPANTIFGDTDDVLMFTARNEGEPFLGRRGGNTIESPLAEVLWSVQSTGTEPRDFYLHRRALLIRPDLNGAAGHLAQSTDSLAALETQARNFLLNNDISVRLSLTDNGGGDYRLRVIANSLNDLSARQNRFAHRALTYTASGGGTNALTDNVISAAFPHLIYGSFFGTMYATGNRAGESVMMSHAISFDVRAYDPQAPLHRDDDTSPTMLIGPGDPGYASVVGNQIEGRGAFVDLAYRPGLGTAFSDNPHVRSRLSSFPTYDTWTAFYESNGFNEDRDSLTDEGADGIDNDDVYGVDNLDHPSYSATDEWRTGEWETRPPYSAPLRGLQVTLRMYETDTRQLRQQQLVTDFIPE